MIDIEIEMKCGWIDKTDKIDKRWKYRERPLEGSW